MSVIVKGGGGKSSGLYVWEKYEFIPPYLSFIGNEDFTLKTANTTKNWDGTLEYSTDTATWNTWDGTEISSVGSKLYLRGTGNTKITGDALTEYSFVFTGTDALKIACEGNIENLLDYETVSAGGHPTMADYCYSYMFYGSTALTTAPALPATTLSRGCYGAMFQDCISLTTVPELPATTLANYCYNGIFYGCTNIKLSSTQTGEYQIAYRIPISGTGTTATSALNHIFTNTGGTFADTPKINTTYYLSTSNIVVQKEVSNGKGNFIEYVVSDGPDKYPNGGEQGGYYYETVRSVFPTGIEITSPPTKTTYNAGENIDLTGIVVTATFSDGSTQDVTSECTFSPTNGTVLYEDTSEVVVSWSYDGAATYTTKQPITVKRVLSNIAITQNPSKTTYYKGDSLSLDGLKVMATFTSGATEEVTSLCTSDPASGYVFSSFGSVSVVISYTENGITKTASFTVIVTLKTVTWANGTDDEIVAMVEAADRGEINLSDYWAVGDTRTVQLSAMLSTGVSESHPAQEVDLVLMHAGGYDLNAAVASGRTKCSFVVGLKDSLTEVGYMNSSNTNSGSWNGSARRTWCNNVFRNAIPSTLRAIFKQFKTVTYDGSTNRISVDYFALPAEREIFDARHSCNQTEYNALFQFDYYKTASNRVKKLGKTGEANRWWERSPHYQYVDSFCAVFGGGYANSSGANSIYGLAPFGCI